MTTNTQTLDETLDGYQAAIDRQADTIRQLTQERDAARRELARAKDELNQKVDLLWQIKQIAGYPISSLVKHAAPPKVEP